MQRQIPLESVGHDIDLMCVDGRHDDCIVGTPGGSVGELLLLCAAAENVGTGDWSDGSILSVAAMWTDRIGRLYLHSDEAALARVGVALDVVIAGGPDDRADLLDRLSRKDGVGCGHLKLMLTYPDHYGVPKELIAEVIEGFFTVLWSGGNARYDVLEGEHAETAIVVMRGGTDPLVTRTHCQRHTETSELAVHPAAQRYVRDKAARMLHNCNVGPFVGGVTIEQLRDEMARLGGLWQAETLRRLAPDLPRRAG
jgi:hypothetical protein